MKRDFRLNDRASSRDASGRLFDLIYGPFSQSGGKPDGRDQGFQATIMKSSVDEVREKGIAFLQGNFDNVIGRQNILHNRSIFLFLVLNSGPIQSSPSLGINTIYIPIHQVPTTALKDTAD